MRMLLGEYLVREGLATGEEIDDALKEQARSGGRLGEILQSRFSIRALDYYRALSGYYGLPFADLTERQPDISLLHEKDRLLYSSALLMPVWREDGETVVATADPGEETFRRIRERWGRGSKIAVTSKFDIFWTLQKAFERKYTDEIVSELYEKAPEKSAFKTFTRPQIGFAAGLIFLSAIILYVSYPTGVIIFNAFLTFSVLLVLLYKLFLSVAGFFTGAGRDDAGIDEKTLPVYTILVPLFREKRVTIEHLAGNIRRLDYPVHRLDVKLVLEGDDHETIGIVKEMRLPSYFEIVRVPPGEPRTKPKACNYALKFARGEFVTIYDAEDRPDVDQLKLAVSAFRRGDEKLACIQCALNYYNSRENWLTRMFTLEYTFWFDLMLPALSRINHPIPLGGTSNHFRTEFLKDMVAWDPFNVTEDADLGIRMNRLGYRSIVANSTTYEEANCRVAGWIKQRTRWIKGYMQTYLVHMRTPVRLLRELGPGGFLGFQLFIGGVVFSNLANILLLVIFFISLVIGYEKTSFMFPSPTIEVAWFNLLAGNLMLIALNLMAALRRRMYGLIPYVVTAPLYWLLASIASYRALHQLFFQPSYWDKTEHGISSFFYAAGKEGKEN